MNGSVELDPLQCAATSPPLPLRSPNGFTLQLLAKNKNRREGCPIPRLSAEWEVLRIALQRNSP
jgi:hypothetical protein